MNDSLDSLVGIMRQYGAIRILAKPLAANDNSKNQIYLGGDFSALNIIPHSNIRLDVSKVAGSQRDRAKAGLQFSWISETGLSEAPHAQLILYPKYPEVRLSGILKNTISGPSALVRSRDEGRVLFLGIVPNGRIIAHIVSARSTTASEFRLLIGLEQVGIFLQLPDASGRKSKTRLIEALTLIYQKRWIASQKLGRDGTTRPYSALNGGGYTLEAELGISPNGIAEPDYLGWEIKQYGVNDFQRLVPRSPITLLTPEPNGGFYQTDGLQAFMKKYGYADKHGKVGRVNFGGIYTCKKGLNANTGLRLQIIGYDQVHGKITDMTGALALLDSKDNIAASWKFPGLIEHWNRKHAQAAYIPSIFRTPPPEYCYGPQITLCQGTDVGLFLKAISEGTIYLDPALKLLAKPDGSFEQKKRNQFRVSHANLREIYQLTETVVLNPSKNEQPV